jgi:16S rRNA (adenine1518-N6/adenine1519-N6)-dimethyltransferase
MTTRQTLSYLSNLFRERGIKPKNKLGQNFLVDLNLVQLLLRTAELTTDDLVVEVGSGTGSLTAHMAEQAGAVLAVEIDPHFLTLTSENIADLSNVVLIHSDILRNKNELNPGVLETLGVLREKTGLPCLKLVANLPYSVATPVITNFLMTDLPFERMVVTVQWEIAERMIAEPGTHVYSSLAIMVQSLADVEIIRQLKPSVFWPKPKVDSAFVLIRPNAERRKHVIESVGEVGRFRTFLRNLYTHRRKNLRGALTGWPTGRREKEDVDRKLVELGIDGTVRAETLDREQHLRLCQVFG